MTFVLFESRWYMPGGASCCLLVHVFPLPLPQQEDGERDAWLAEMDEGAMEEAIGAASAR